MSHNLSTKGRTESIDNLGVSEAEPGFTCVRVAPDPGDIREAKGDVRIPDGVVSVSWVDSAVVFSLDVSVPVGVHLQVRLPASLEDLLFVDDEPIAEDSQAVRSEQFVELAVLPGSGYHFEVHKFVKA
jgi:hypothetical protein